MALPGLDELGAGIFVYEIPGPIAVNAGIVVGDAGVLVIDTGTVEADARRVVEAVRSVTSRPVRYVVNSHHHGDHAFGNRWLRPAVLVGHERCRLRLVGEAGEAHREMIAALVPAAREQVLAVPIDPPEVTFDAAMRVDLGTHAVRLEFLGRGHTDNDIVATVEGRDVVFAGDLVEESGPPFAAEGFTAEWGPTLRRLAARPERVIVPGHGRPMDRRAVEAQALAFEQVAGACARADTPAAALAQVPDHARAVLGAQLAAAVQRAFDTAATA